MEEYEKERARLNNEILEVTTDIIECRNVIKILEKEIEELENKIVGLKAAYDGVTLNN